MANYKQTRKVEGIIASCMLALVAVVVFAVFSFVSLGKARRKDAAYDETIAKLKNEQTMLENNLDYMSSQEYLESQARDHLGMIKENENLYVFK